MLKLPYNQANTSINNSMEKIKSFLNSETGKDILVVFIVILVGLGSFELGRLSKENTSSGVKIEYPDQQANVISATESNQINSNFAENSVNNDTVKNSKISSTTTLVNKNFFASKRGKKYYSLGCSAGKSIKQDNRVYFSSEADAVKAGFEKSSSCN